MKREITICIEEEHFQLCKEFYLNTPEFRKSFTWPEALSYLCTYGIVTVWDIYNAAQYCNIDELEKQLHINFGPNFEGGVMNETKKI